MSQWRVATYMSCDHGGSLVLPRDFLEVAGVVLLLHLNHMLAAAACSKGCLLTRPLHAGGSLL